jgi:PAB1-binding protein PBP1
MEEEIKKLLELIIHRRMEVKSKLYMISSLLNEDKFNYQYQKDLDKLLDKLNELDKLEKEIRKKL